ncbi:hypothetical protein X777_03477 [Ooceraea biroi]|uniref:C2H2-type domain-containing protein n=1 Tax=Ooceraea biroi TaxID=2015173 RepID=A0A026WJH6_OOCBI|nr:hypothetical protein X777_03477 [Ooceraea biroi]
MGSVLEPAELEDGLARANNLGGIGLMLHHEPSACRKLKCPFCERLYGYETNLRAHVRQRHQGIRVPCPFCERTFTRNNTVRRHIAREHKSEVTYSKAFQQSNHSVSDTLPQ